MNRRTARQNAFIALFSFSFGEDLEEIITVACEADAETPLDDFGAGLLRTYAAHAIQVDERIESKLKGWKVERLSRVSLAILRLAVAEMTFGDGDMDSVSINEAVELAKKYGDEGDYQFVNGVLGSLSREKSAGDAPADAANVVLPAEDGAVPAELPQALETVAPVEEPVLPEAATPETTAPTETAPKEKQKNESK